MSINRQELEDKRAATQYYHYELWDGDMRWKIFQYLWQYCYVFDNKDCVCPFRAQTITFKTRYGKRFDRRIKRYCELFGFETTSGPIFDFTILPPHKESLQEIRQFIADCLKNNQESSKR